MVLARRIRIIGFPVDWILEVTGEDEPVIAVVPAYERTDDYPYNGKYNLGEI